MIRHRSKRQVRFFDIFKLVIAIILILLLLYFWFWRTGTGQPSGETIADQPPATPTEAVAQEEAVPTETAVPEETPPTDTPEPELTATPEPVQPTVDLPSGELVAGQVALSGTGEPGSTVEIIADGEVIGTATVGSDGTWSFTADLPEAGDYELSVRTVAADGSILAESDPLALSLAASELAAPTLDLPAGDLEAGEVELTGTGEPGSQIQIVLDGEVIGTTTVDSDGTWSFTADLPEAGDYQLAIRALDADGTVVAESKTLSLAVTERMAAASEPAESSEETGGQAYLVQRDDWLSKLAAKFYGDIFAYPVIVEATNAKAAEDDSFTVIDNPDLIEIGQKLWIPDGSEIQ